MALGIIEVYGFVTAIVVADIAAKAADVQILSLDKNKPAGGDDVRVPLIMTVNITGEVSAVEEAVAAGVSAAKTRDLYVTHHVIGRQAPSTNKMAGICAVGRDKL